jgi:hypothetical protein
MVKEFDTHENRVQAQVVRIGVRGNEDSDGAYVPAAFPVQAATRTRRRSGNMCRRRTGLVGDVDRQHPLPVGLFPEKPSGGPTYSRHSDGTLDHCAS